MHAKIFEKGFIDFPLNNSYRIKTQIMKQSSKIKRCKDYKKLPLKRKAAQFCYRYICYLFGLFIYLFFIFT